jgi:hypothetical protein
LIELGRLLRSFDYRFVAVTPETHRRANAQAPRLAQSLRDVFGWNRPFRLALLPRGLLRALGRANALSHTEDGLSSGVRFASLGSKLLVHDASVGLGPDVYRMARWLGHLELHARRAIVLDAGCGAAGIVARDFADSVLLADSSPRALDLLQVNVELNEMSDVRVVDGELLENAGGSFDLVILQPTSREAAVSALTRGLRLLEPEGKLLLYARSAIVGGVDTLFRALEPMLKGREYSYEELDPDICDPTAGRGVERVAGVGLVVSA